MAKVHDRVMRSVCVYVGGRRGSAKTIWKEKIKKKKGMQQVEEEKGEGTRSGRRRFRTTG